MTDAHVCRRWLEIAEKCPLGSRAWHGEPHTTEDEPEDPRRPRPLRQLQEQETWQGLAYKAAVIYAMRETLKGLRLNLKPAYVPAGLPALFPITEAVMLAELGIIQSQMPSPGRLLKPQTVPRRPDLVEQYGEIIEWGVKTTALITAGLVFWKLRPTGKPFTGAPWSTGKGGAFQTQNIWGGGRKNPLWKIGMENARLLSMAIKTGRSSSELLEEWELVAQNGLWNQNAWADPGLG